MTTITIAPEQALEIAEAERMLIRAWDLQRREKAPPYAETISDEQIARAATQLEDLEQILPPEQREETARLVRIVRTRLNLATQ